MFEESSLLEAGLPPIQLGHRDGSVCTNPHPARRGFCAIHINGRHSLPIHFCACDRASDSGTLVQQLLRHGLYPATTTEPNTVFTFALLEHYHIQSLQGKISMFDYYETLDRLTDNTGTKKLNSRYKEFMRVVAQWRLLKRLKRAGRGHDPTGAAGTAPGELAVRCPACPRPGVNLPPNWEEVSDDLKYVSFQFLITAFSHVDFRRFLYVQSIAIDACFRLKRRAVSNEDKDPILGSGWGYFVEDTGYKEWLAGQTDQTEVRNVPLREIHRLTCMLEQMSTCTGLSAVDHANTKFHKGYAATGVGAVVCARHEFMLPNGVGDTQVGER